MVEQLVTRFRALLGGRGDDERAEAGFEDEPAVLGFDPEWEELIAWARESEDETEWAAMIARAKQAAANEDSEWAQLLARAKAISATVKARPVPAVVSVPAAHAPAGSLTSLSARLDRLAAQVPNARRAR
jgi:hypothetical protein